MVSMVGNLYKKNVIWGILKASKGVKDHLQRQKIHSILAW